MLDFSKTQIGFDRRLSDYSKIQWLMTKLLRNNRLFHRKVGPGSYVNLGCGPNINRDFVNIDASWMPGLDICCDITRGLPITDEFVSGIFSEHCLEHLSLDDARTLLAECRRVLVPKSIIRIVVPDLEHYARAYVNALDGGSAVNTTNVRHLMARINDLFYGSGHRFIYDFQTLADLLSEAGFGEIKRCSFDVGSDKRLLIDSPARRIESLYVEATKC